MVGVRDTLDLSSPLLVAGSVSHHRGGLYSREELAASDGGGREEASGSVCRTLWRSRPL